MALFVKSTVAEIGQTNEYRVLIKGDVGDADVNETMTCFEESNFEEALPYLLAIKRLEGDNQGFAKRKRHWAAYYSQAFIEQLDEELVEYLNIPASDWDYCHTIDSIDIFWIDEVGAKFRIELNDSEIDESFKVGIVALNTDGVAH